MSNYKNFKLSDLQDREEDHEEQLKAAAVTEYIYFRRRSERFFHLQMII